MNQPEANPAVPARACPKCASPAAPQADFCGACGQRLDHVAASPPDAAPATAAPAEQSPANDAPNPGTTPVGLVVYDARSNKRLTSPDATKVVVGKSRTCDVPLQDDHVSRRHCQIGMTPDGIIVEDASANGTWIRVKNAAITIRSGDVIMVGHTALRIEEAKA
jgi:pSer/pThr/pTyr-binding forkhead associated (FHA) protein